ncbi:19996_t:CDS:2, partial [Funneliformis geosporum]
MNYIEFNHNQNHVQCLAHIINIAVQEILQYIETENIEEENIFNKATKHMSQSQYITLSSSIPIYNVLLDHLEKLLDVKSNNYCHYSEIRTAVKKGYEKLKKYYIKTDKSYVYPVATILDPRIKLKYYQTQEWEQEYINAALET